jgi:hypothetical protein
MTDGAHLSHAMRGTNGSIILCHCGPATTVRIMARVIAAYKARGMTFVTVQQLLGLQPMSAATASASAPSMAQPAILPQPGANPAPRWSLARHRTPEVRTRET